MNNKFDSIKHMTIQQLLEIAIMHNIDANKSQQIYNCIFNPDGVDYKGLSLLIPVLDADDLSIILRYDNDYKMSFLLSIASKAYEEDITKQAIFLLNRYNLNYILPLFEYIDEDEIRQAYFKKNNP